MDIPKFLLADNADFPASIFVLHTKFPRFLVNLATDEIEWFEEFDQQDEAELVNQVESLLHQAQDFYEAEIKKYEDDSL